MNNLYMTITYYFEQKYLPSKRHRNPRVREMVTTTTVAVKEIEDCNEFPIAMIIKDHGSLYRGAKSYDEICRRNDGSYEEILDELRYYGGKLYRARRISYGAAVSDLYEDPIDAIRGDLNSVARMNRDFYDMPEVINGVEPIVVSDTKKEMIWELQQKANDFIIFDKKCWEECGEPMYVVQTFGLGHNHGGTGLSIEQHYNPNIGKRNYFNALHRQDAIDYANEVAKRRGDTKDIGRFGNHEDIIALMPEAVTRQPEKDHGDGDPFLNSLEAITETADSAADAGLLAILTTAAQVEGGMA